MFLVGIGIYTLVMVIVWGFFLVAKIHVDKFKDYSPAVVPMMKLLAIALILLTALGYYYISVMNKSTTEKTSTVEETTTREIY